MISILILACIAEANCSDQPEYDIRYNLEDGRLILDLGQNQQATTFNPRYVPDNERIIFDMNQDILDKNR